MATMVIVNNSNTDHYTNDDAIHNLIYYIWGFRAGKPYSKIVGGLGIDISSPYMIQMSMEYIQRYHRKHSGNKMIHFVVSFDCFEMKHLNWVQYFKIGYSIAAYFKKGYQIVFALHQDTGNYHFHYALNPVNCLTGKKYRWGKNGVKYFKSHVDRVISRYLPKREFYNWGQVNEEIPIMDERSIPDFPDI